VLATHFFHDLGLSELWIGFGSGKTYNIYHISEMLGLQRCQALSFFHAFTGCEVVSSMMGIGKKTAWNALVNFTKATTTFTAITQDPARLTLDSLHMSRLERLTVLMFSKNCAAQSVNEASKLMFTHGLKSLDSIHQPRMLSSSMPSGLFTQQDLSGSSLSRESQRSRIPVTGAGNEMPEPTSGCHIGRICQTSARLARCSYAGVWLHVRVTASVISLTGFNTI